MSHNRNSLPARVAGVVSFCIAAAFCTQAGAAGTTSSSSANAPAASAGAGNAMSAKDAKVASSDRKFMEKAAQGGMAEVKLGQLATQKAGSDQVRQFGQRMVDDHSKADEQLKQVASNKGVTLPTELDKSTQKEYDKLSKLSGADFDREYMKHMVSDHKQDVGDFKAQASKAKDPDLKAFAASTLPTLEQHLTLAQSTEKATNAKSGDATQTTTSKGMSKTGS